MAIAACGSNQKLSSTTTGTTPGSARSPKTTTVDIYSSLPDSGADAARSHQIETGIRLALRQPHSTPRRFKVDYTQLCDSARPRHRSHGPTSRDKISSSGHEASRHCTGNWSATAVVGNAHRAASDANTVAYIGDLNSGATALSLPILNQAGIVQITPGSGYTGLTNSVKPYKTMPITGADEPGKYYPQGTSTDKRTLLRMIPNDLVQASAALKVLQQAHCQKLSAWEFGSDLESKSLLAAVIATATLKYKMTYVTPHALPAKFPYENYAAHVVAPTGIHCAILVGHVTRSAEQLTLELRAQLGSAFTIVGTTGFCTPDWLRGIPSVDRKNVAAVLYCTTPARPVKDYDGYAKFVALFRRSDHREPTAYNLYGYVATVMLLRALKDIPSGDDARQQVLSGMVEDFAPIEVDNTRGQVSAFSFDTSGNVGSNAYGIDVFRRGRPQYKRTVTIDSATDLLSSDG
ncbi:MAG TPA: hypothetical protein VHU61_18245 [Solirubrobacteraceae bacterium]|nr:hypothetical protein [Solirubrobacteraceae bacterium]